MTPYTLISDESQALDEAAARARANGAPVAVLMRDKWYRVVEDADDYEDLCDAGWQSVALVDPEESSEDDGVRR